MKRNSIVILILFAVTACNLGTQQVVEKTATQKPPPTATFAPTPTVAPTATLMLFPVQLAMNGLTCPSETVFSGQEVFIRHLFQFGHGRHINYAKWMVKSGVVTVSIKGTKPESEQLFTLKNDPKLWTEIETVDKGSLGKFDQTTFEWDKFPLLAADTYRIDVVFGIPALSLERLYPYCGNLTVTPR